MLPGSFQCIGGFFVPCLSIDANGSPRQPDGVRYFNFRDVAARTGIEESVVQSAYEAFLCEVGVGIHRESQAVESVDAVRHRFAHLSDTHFTEYLEICRVKKFDPCGRHLWAGVKAGRSGNPDLYVELTADGFYAVAMRTGEVERIVGPEWCGPDRMWVSVWTSSEPPSAARVGIVRRGMTEPLYMVARWDSYAPFAMVAGKRRYDEFWTKMPDFMLGKCAACAAIRRAFAEVLDGVYCPEEMAQAHRVPVGPHRVVADDSDSPQTHQQFHLRLIDLGLGKAAIRNSVVERLVEELPMLYRTNLTAFYAAAIKRVRADPSTYADAIPMTT